MTNNILARGDALEPQPDDLIVQVRTLPVGTPLPEGWTVTDGNMHNSEIIRVLTRWQLEQEGKA